ncbi:hypothetical protein GDO86_016939 [Hymenochirus boettgeri]|uniref:Uncharacterized protein n=1 Tax=Hymenochirus boettgeri TaxID=247094 RepID=A0A8T2IKZ3_9PIPI|nr:hypothetical protein GDO86_016939 [Hymenochirus boettgeri]
MQKTAYYEKFWGLGGYTCAKTRILQYGPSQQTYPQSNLDNDYPSGCLFYPAAPIRAHPNHKKSDISGHCMRTTSSQKQTKAPSISNQQHQAPSLPPSSPSHGNTSAQKRANLPVPPALPRHNEPNRFPWMKESGRNKQKNASTPPGKQPGENCEEKSQLDPFLRESDAYTSAQLVSGEGISLQPVPLSA